MVTNRSVPADVVLPAAIDWLGRAFGFVEHYRYGDPTPAELGFGTQSLTVFVEDLDAHLAQAKAAGAEIVEDLHETMYGERAVRSARPGRAPLAVLKTCPGREPGGLGCEFENTLKKRF